MGLGDFLDDLGEMAGDIVKGTVSVAGDVLNGAATVVGDVTDGVTTVASDLVELAGEGAGTVIGVMSESAGEVVKRSGRLVANGVRVPGRAFAGGVKTVAGVATGVANLVVGNDAKADEIGCSVGEALDEACESVRDSAEQMAGDISVILPPLRGPIQMFLMDHVIPVPGSIACCDLAVAVEHSGVYIGDGKIIHRDGDGYLACVDKDTFLGRLNGFNPSITVFVACRGGEPVGGEEVVERTVRAMSNPEHAFGNSPLTPNCHQFCQYCLTGRVDNGLTDFTFSHLESLLHHVFSVDSWRVLDGCWKC